MIHYRTLRTFLAVADTGSFSAAAERVALTQAAVSIQMRTLEQTLGTNLFEKVGRQLVLSPKGIELHPKIEEIVRLTHELYPKSKNLKNTKLTLGAVVSVLSTLSTVASGLKKNYPELDIRLHYARSNELQDMVLARELDAAYIIGQKEHSLKAGLSWKSLYQEPYIILAPAQSQATDMLNLFKEYSYITFDANTRTGKQVDSILNMLKLKPQRHFEINAIDTIVSLVKQGVGISILPKLHWAHWELDHQLRIYPLPPPIVYREIGMITRHQHEKPELLNAVMEMFTQVNQG